MMHGQQNTNCENQFLFTFTKFTILFSTILLQSGAVQMYQSHRL
jgi:hypothetical protein